MAGTRFAILVLAVGVAASAALVSRASVASSRITVYAAASLTNVFPKIDARPRYSFGGSNTLAAQIEQGAPADVFASADSVLPRQLFAKRLCSKPVVFARNQLIVVVPRSNPAGIRRVSDLAGSGVKIVIADAGVPVGSYTLQVLKRLDLTDGVLANVVSRETDVREVLAKVALGEADAGFVYATDAKAAGPKVKVVKIPGRAQPRIAYAMCVVGSGSHTRAARAFVHEVLGKRGQAQLRKAGFLPRPKSKRR